MGVAARQHKHVLDAVFCRPLRPVPDRFEPTRRIGAGDFDLFAEVGGASGGLDCSWPSSFGCGVLSALFHGQEDHRASLALAILILSSLSSSFLVPLLAGSSPRLWTCGGVVGRRRSDWSLAPSWATTDRDLRCGALWGSSPSRPFAWAMRRLASKPVTTGRPRGPTSVLARYWLIWERNMGGR